MEEKITVMIVDDIEQTRTDIKRLLYFEEDMEVVAEAADGLEAIKLAQQFRPQAILMDINMPGMDGIEATERISMTVPETSIIIISIQGEMEYLRKAMVAGARDYLVKPLSSDRLSQTIRQATALQKQKRQKGGTAEISRQTARNYVRCCYSPAGGVGKSVIAANLAVLMARKQQKVALLDADLQFGSIALNLNLKPDRTWEDLAGEDLKEEDITSFLIPHFSGVKVLASPARPQAEEIIKAETLRETIKLLRAGFDEIILDLPSVMNDKTVEMMEEADEILLLVSPDLAAVRKVKIALESMQTLELAGKVHLVVNKVGKPESLRIKDIEEVLGMEASFCIPDAEKLLLNSINRGIPFVLNKSTAEISLALEKMLNNNLSEQKKARKRGVLGFFTI